FEEHQQKSIPNNTLGVDRVLLEELQLIGHYSKLLAQNSANFDIMNDVKRYIRDATTQPLIVSGARGCGKSVLVSKIMENVHRWKPEAQLVLRYANLSARSSDLTSLLGSIANQMSVLETGQQCHVLHTLEAYAGVIREILGRQQRFFVLIIDGLDELQRDAALDWLPLQLGSCGKLILTVSEMEDEDAANAGADGDESFDMLAALAQLGIPPRCFLRLRQFTERQWHDILSSGGGDFYAANGALKLPDDWKSLHGKTPYHAKSLWWLAWLGHVAQPISEIGDISSKILQVLESKFAADQVELLLLIVRLSPWGIRESDCLGVFQKITQLEAQVVFKIWSKFCWLMGPMLLGLKNIRIADRSFGRAVLARYAQKQWLVHEALRDYFDRQDSEFKGSATAKTYNYQKYLKLPYHHFCAVIEDKPAPHKIDILFNCFYFTDLQWIANKVHATGPEHLMHDILHAEWLAGLNGSNGYVHINFLKHFLVRYLHELSYDGQQFYTLMKYYLKSRFKDASTLKDDEKIRSWWEHTNELEFAFLEILNADLDATDTDTATNATDDNGKPLVRGYDVLMNLPQPGCYVASLCTERAEICIWDVKNCCRIRELQGIQQPTAMCPVGNYEAAVLCRREIRVINLDEGKFKVTLKGVMNQKMPYFGLHDQNHLVCLSRNRMYVNLMNLESGDCVTTFKAGEDRFLNSLLVSGDGRILVCGDETQKPFPLLVWHLSQRKLLYDLRIPHHDFVTSLSAITHEGSYVCVVAKELNEPSTPNFIVVYDLQSGTLFKKWKPTCNTVALAISQLNACVIAGLEDAKIMIWDLVTGNCKCTLIGHNAPVTFLKLDPLGKVLMSYDKEGRDTAIRMWELSTAKSLAVFKPPAQISTCEILPSGAFAVLALKDRNDLLTLALKNYAGNSANALEDDCGTLYGNPDNQHKVFNLSN
ncbi:GH10482, partial [Drosophila grimshawi]